LDFRADWTDVCRQTRIEWDRSTAPACVASPRPGYVAATELFLSRDDGSSRGLLCSGPLVTEPRPLLRSMSRFPQSNQAFAERINRPHNNTLRIFRGIVLPLNALAFSSHLRLYHDKINSKLFNCSMPSSSASNNRDTQDNRTPRIPLRLSLTGPHRACLCLSSGRPGFVAATVGRVLCSHGSREEGDSCVVVVGCVLLFFGSGKKSSYG